MKTKLVKSVADYARDIPLCRTETERFIDMYKAVDRLRTVLNALLADSLPKRGINPWFKENIDDAMNELVAHLEIAGALQESVEFACLAHRKNRETLIDFIRFIAESDTELGRLAAKKLKAWNLNP